MAMLSGNTSYSTTIRVDGTDGNSLSDFLLVAQVPSDKLT